MSGNVFGELIDRQSPPDGAARARRRRAGDAHENPPVRGLNERVLFPQSLARRAAVAPRPHDSSAESKFRLFGSRLDP
jgi:hypothetical protein